MLTTIAVPASVANLGPGFDTLAVAVQLYLRVRIVDVKQDGQGTLSVRQAEPPVPDVNGVAAAYQSRAKMLRLMRLIKRTSVRAP